MKIYHALAEIAHLLNHSNQLPSLLDTQVQRLDKLVKIAPSGIEFAEGTEFISEQSGYHKLLLRTSYHHVDRNVKGDIVNEAWTEHFITITPMLTPSAFIIHISGPNKNGIKQLISSVFDDYLTMDEPK